MLNIVSVNKSEDVEVYAREGYGPGSLAVGVEWGFSTGNETWQHTFLNTFAIAELGVLDENGKFESVVYTKEDAPNRQVIGMPKNYEGWNPDEDLNDDINWGKLDNWIKQYCEEVL